jgi:hypothetical protein
VKRFGPCYSHKGAGLTRFSQTTTTTSCDLAKSDPVKKPEAPHIRWTKIAPESALDARWALDKVFFQFQCSKRLSHWHCTIGLG